MKGLCLSGGGIKAAAHIGALKALEEKNIKFDCVSGTSSGSIIATMYALGYKSDEMYEMFKKYSKKIKYVELKNILKLIYGIIFKGRIIVEGLNSGKVIERIVDDICKQKGITNINEIKIPLLIPMVDIVTGEVLVATSKEARIKNSDMVTYVSDMPIGKAVRASCSFPVVFSPCEYNGKQLIDGGTRENLPWKELKAIGAEEVIGINFETILEKDDYYESFIDIATRSIDLVCHELFIYEKAGIDTLVDIPVKKISLLDDSKSEELYVIGYNAMKKYLKSNISKKLH